MFVGLGGAGKTRLSLEYCNGKLMGVRAVVEVIWFIVSKVVLIVCRKAGIL